MFSAISNAFQGIFSKLCGPKQLTEANLADAISDVRLALLEADVQYGVAKTLIQRVKARALGTELLKQLEPAQQFAKIVHDELVALMSGGEEQQLQFKTRPARLMLCGLQGAGKTTHAVKLAVHLRKQGTFLRPCVVACDLKRPGAVEQLKTLAASAGIDSFAVPGAQDPLQVARQALTSQADLLIFDTAGRLHVDEELMEELKQLKALVQPEELLFVANAATGQDAVTSAQHFHEAIGITGSILTMLDGSARAGAAISIREITGKPLLFEGVGERIEDLQPFHPISMADRVLGMGDTINLVRKVQEHVNEAEAKRLETKIRTATFTYEDYLAQMRTVRKMGSFTSLLGMIPGLSRLKDMPAIDDKELQRVEAIILSMTPRERQEIDEFTIPRRKRVARGAGATLDDVHRLVKSSRQAKEFFKQAPSKRELAGILGGSTWR